MISSSMRPFSPTPLKIPVPPPAPKALIPAIPTKLPSPHPLTRESLADFLEELGLLGMGGAGFPAADKIRAAQKVHTLVINGVECEPGVSIDQSLLFHHAEWIKNGAETTARAIGAQEIILCVNASTKNLPDLHQLYPYGIETFPAHYPSGAEPLLIQRLTQAPRPPRNRPTDLGFLVFNVATLRAIGRTLLDQIPVTERPLTLANAITGFYQNLIVPLHIPIAQLLAATECPFNPATQQLIAGGLMMGQSVAPETLIEQTTTSIIIWPQINHQEQPCIRCGACNESCPLQLHPIALTERIQRGKTNSKAFQTQMDECFLCGVCSAVCPSSIPLVQHLMEGKKCLR